MYFKWDQENFFKGNVFRRLTFNGNQHSRGHLKPVETLCYSKAPDIVEPRELLLFKSFSKQLHMACEVIISMKNGVRITFKEKNWNLIPKPNRF